MLLIGEKSDICDLYNLIQHIDGSTQKSLDAFTMQSNTNINVNVNHTVCILHRIHHASAYVALITQLKPI